MWTEVLQNPEAIKNIFETPPSLESVEIISITVDRDGPTVTLAIALKERPTKSSVKWERIGANAVVLNLQLLAVSKLSLEGWAPEITAELRIEEKENDPIRVSAIGPNIMLACSCGFVRVSGISAYHRDESLLH